MFGFVSQKKYNELEAQYRAAKSDWLAECYAKMFSVEDYARLQKTVIDLQKENQSMQEQIAQWKQMYADEVQKRIDLCEKVQTIKG